MPLNLAQVHKYEKIDGTTEMRLTEVHPATCFTEGDNPDIWVQDGKIYYDGGQEVTEIPEWFWAMVRNLSPEQRKRLKLSLPGESPGNGKSHSEANPVSQPKLKTCPDCGKEGVKNMGAHTRFCPKKEGS